LPDPLKILHIITGLSLGGAETMLAKVLAALPRSEVENSVVSLGPRGPVAERIEALGVPLTCLDASRALGGMLSAPRSLMSLVHLMREQRPDVVQCWMYHANLFGGLAARLAGSPPVVWGLRQSNLDPARTKATTRMIAGLGARFSRTLPTKILACADAVKTVHAAMGYDPARIEVIPNGFDTSIFRPDPEARMRIRNELGIAADAPVIGLPARYDPQKDHFGFLTAAGEVLAMKPNAVFMLCGEGTGADNTALSSLIASAKLPPSSLRRLGERRDMPAVMAAFDVIVSASAFGEGFPNVLGEGMAACAMPVATDSGDSRAIIEGIGFTVPVSRPDALAEAMLAALDLPAEERTRRNQAGRVRVVEKYDISVVARRYLALWQEAAQKTTKGSH
jgi:glycosyltransferase involved in cell wall biosynthesis